MKLSWTPPANRCFFKYNQAHIFKRKRGRLLRGNLTKSSVVTWENVPIECSGGNSRKSHQVPTHWLQHSTKVFFERESNSCGRLASRTNMRLLFTALSNRSITLIFLEQVQAMKNLPIWCIFGTFLSLVIDNGNV